MPFKDPEVRKEYIKQYRSTPEYKQYMKLYNATDKYKEYRKTKTSCTCGLEITNRQMSRHKNTKKHNDLLTTITIPNEIVN